MRVRFSRSFRQPEREAEPLVEAATFPRKLLLSIVFAVCILGPLLISQRILLHNSIRLDEAQSLWQTSHSIGGTLKVVAQDVHVPLYHLILHFWQIFVGQGIEQARLLSFIFFIATMPLVYLLARRIVPYGWALFALVLFSFSPFMNWYANEARMYTLLALVATASQYYFVKLIQTKGKIGWAGYTITALIGVYTHYFFLFNLAVQGIYFLLARRQFEKGTFKRLLILASVLFIELLPWLLYFFSLGAASNTSPDLPKPSTVDLFNVFSQFSFGFQNDRVNTILVSLWPLTVLIALLFVHRGQRLTKSTGYIILAAFGPIVLAFVASYLLTPFFLSRYMVACLAPLVIVVVWFISYYGRRWSLVVAAAAVLLLLGVSLQQYYSPSTPVKENYRKAAQIVSQQANARDIVVLSAPFTVYPFDYYYQGDAKVVTLPEWDRTQIGAIPPFKTSALPKEVNDLRKNHEYAFVLLSYDQGYEDQVYQYFERHFERKEIMTLSDDMRLAVYRVGYNESKPISELANAP